MLLIEKHEINFNADLCVGKLSIQLILSYAYKI